MGLDDLLIQAGGFGRFQVMMFISVNLGMLFGGWSMFQMTFAGIVPDFQCQRNSEDDDFDFLTFNFTANSTADSTFDSTCSVPSNDNESSHDCVAFNFTGPYQTVVREWSLVCDRAWIKPTMTSIQMAGLMFGCLTAGQLGDAIGRWKAYLGFVVLHSLSNFGAAFSTGWEMFAAARFVIGAGIGGILVLSFTFSIEFFPTRWRPICATIPFWPVGTAVFSLVAYLLEDWRQLHLVCGACSLIQVPLLFFVPESPRWLTVHERLDQAEATISKIARWNGRPQVENARQTLEAIAREEKRARESGQIYTYLDVMRPWSTAKVTFIMCYHWFCYSMAFYGISFGISALAGNVFLNIFLVGIVGVPLELCIVYLNNRIGRKWTALPLSALALVCLVACLALQLTGLGGNGSAVITTLSVFAKMGAAVAWNVTQIWCTELYPTVIRNLGYGVANSAARVAGILSPIVIDFNSRLTLSYIIMGVLLVIDLIFILLLPDTKDRAMTDTVLRNNKRTELEREEKQTWVNTQAELLSPGAVSSTMEKSGAIHVNRNSVANGKRISAENTEDAGLHDNERPGGSSPRLSKDPYVSTKL